MDMGLLIPDGDNLVTYFVLPMLDLNRMVFGSSYNTAYISQTNLVYIKLHRNMTSPIYRLNSNYVNDLILEGQLYLIFRIPPYRADDLALFKEGLYSKMSRDIKQLIYRTSGLPYNQRMSDFNVTHPILHSLDSTKILRRFLMDYLNVKVIADTNELIDPPYENWYIESVLVHKNT